MLRRLLLCTALFGASTSAGAHQIKYGAIASLDPYAPYSFLIGNWDVSTPGDTKPFVRVKFGWATNHAYIRYGAYIGEAPHFEGMMMWNGVHHNLDVLLATDMQHGLAQESGAATIRNGVLVQETVATYSAGVGAGGAVSGPHGSTQRMRETMRPLDRNHLAVTFDMETPSGWKPVIPGADRLVMTRVAHD